MSIKKIIKSTTIYKKIYDYRWRERLTHPGKEHPSETFYVIRRHANRAGLFSFFITNLGSIKYAVEHGYIPVIDMQNSPNPLLAPDEVGKVNAWDLFFQQPCGYTLNDIEHSANVILSSINPPKDYPDHPILGDEALIKSWQAFAAKNIKLNPDIIAAGDEYINANFGRRKILGVLCRGTDYTSSKPKDHPVQPELDTVISDVKSLLQEKRYDLIYLATEDIDIWNRFNAEFPDLVLSYQQNHYSTASGENINDVANKVMSPRERNREYLISITILSKCNALLAGATSGSIGALLMSQSYEYYKIYQLGLYE